jgi:hypothetical protein
VVVQLQDQRDLTGELTGARLEEAQRRRVGVAARLDGELEVIARFVAGRVPGEAARRSVLEALVHREDHHLARAGQGAGVEHPGEIGERAGLSLPYQLRISRTRSVVAT